MPISSPSDAGADLVPVGGQGRASQGYAVVGQAQAVTVYIARLDGVIGGKVHGVEGVQKHFGGILFSWDLFRGPVFCAGQTSIDMCLLTCTRVDFTARTREGCIRVCQDRWFSQRFLHTRAHPHIRLQYLRNWLCKLGLANGAYYGRSRLFVDEPSKIQT
jgi:hypothetical protein